MKLYIFKLQNNASFTLTVAYVPLMQSSIHFEWVFVRGQSFNEIVRADESNERHKGSRVMCVRLKKNLKRGRVARVFIFLLFVSNLIATAWLRFSWFKVLLQPE